MAVPEQFTSLGAGVHARVLEPLVRLRLQSSSLERLLEMEAKCAVLGLMAVRDSQPVLLGRFQVLVPMLVL
jgi:hypothetical protein